MHEKNGISIESGGGGWGEESGEQSLLGMEEKVCFWFQERETWIFNFLKAIRNHFALP